MKSRSYREILDLSTFEERFEYLRLRGAVGESTFGFDRYINQGFYRSREWKQVRQKVISRDEGCDLGIPGREIYDNIIVHHINPMTVDSIKEGSVDILDLDNLICVTHNTHNAIHYGDAGLLIQPLVERRPGDTSPWKRQA
jgi:hypothetical protein